MAGTIEPASDGKVWAYYNITDTSSTTEILHSTGNVSGMEVDGVSQTVNRYYQFDTTGEHLVKFSLTDNTFVRYDYPPNVNDDGMFRDVTALTKVYLPSTVLRMSHAFRGCSNLTEVHADSLRCVGNWGFSNCSNLTGDLSLPSLDGSQTGGNQYATIGRHSFYSAGYSRIVNLGNMVYLGGSGGGEGCFANMPNLTYAELPATLEKYDSHIFHDCTKLTTVVMRGSTPPVPTSSGAKFFGYQPAADCRIFVPKDAVDTYKAAEGWSMYASMIYPLWEGDISLNHLSLGDFRRRIMMGISLPSSSSVVPSGYTQCDWIAPEVGAMPYIRLGEIKNQQVRAFEVGVTMTGQASADDWQVILGGCTNFSYSFSIWINNSWGTLGGGTAESPNDRYYYYTIGERLIIKAENDLLYVNGNSVGTYRLSVPDPYWQYVCLFSRWTNGSPSSQYFAGRIHYAKFYDTNGDLLWDGVACRRDSDNKYGFYDSVSQSFFGKEGGNGEFTGQLL